MQERYGAAWYFNPARWRTTDGYVPFFVAIHAFAAMHATDAATRLSLVRAISLAMADPDARRAPLAEDARAARGA